MKTCLGVCASVAAMLSVHSPVVSAHWPDQPPHQTANLGDLQLEGGGVIHNLKMTYVTHGKLDAAKDNAILFMHDLDARKPIVVLAGVHAGCYELFGNESVHSIRDLKGKTVSIQYLGGGDQVMLWSMRLHEVGMLKSDPNQLIARGTDWRF